tara:strand:+ start:1160 stop:1918 length:759 start_codon:yes stop_codon:yes gene_type:complete
MNNQELKQKYDNIFKGDASNFFTSDGFYEALSIAACCDWKNKKVLDIGCGEGRLASMIAGAAASEVIGIDYSAEAIINASNRFNLPNLQFITNDYRSVEGKFDLVTMQGVMEHFDNPWEELQHIIENIVSNEGMVVTSSPSFLNPRGYVWMTLAKLFNVPMSLTDLHFICPFDMINFCDEHGYGLEYESIYQEWGCGKTMLIDLKKRLTNALRDANMNNTKVDSLLDWLSQASEFFTQDNDSGAIVIYKITK